jgi:hypothetical protein
METNEDFFLEVSTNGGSSYTIFKTWKRGVDFQNNSRVQVWGLPITGFTWTSQTRFRLRCDASANDDNVYIDDVIIRTCLNYPALEAPVLTIDPAVSNETQHHYNPEDVILTPNPVASQLHLGGMSLENAIIHVLSASGSVMPNARLAEKLLDVSSLNPGLYFVRIEKEGQVIVKRFIKE